MVNPNRIIARSQLRTGRAGSFRTTRVVKPASSMYGASSRNRASSQSSWRFSAIFNLYFNSAPTPQERALASLYLLTHSSSPCQGECPEPGLLRRGIAHFDNRGRPHSVRVREVLGGLAQGRGVERDRLSGGHVRSPIELHRCQPIPFFCGPPREKNLRQCDRARSKTAPLHGSCGGSCTHAQMSPGQDRPRG